MFDKSPIGIFFYDKEGNTVNANNSALEMMGISKLSDICGHNLFDNPYINEKKDGLLKEGIIRFQAPLNLEKIKDYGLYSHKKEITFLDYTVSATDSGFIVQIQDIDEGKKASDQLKYQANILDNVSEPIIATDLNRVITSWNKAAEELYGYKADEAIGSLVSDIIKSEFTDEERKKALNYLSKGYEYPVEVKQYDKDGNPIYIESVIIPIYKEDKVAGYVALNHNITEYKQKEEALRRSKEIYQQFFENPLNGVALCEIITDDKGEPVDYIHLKVNKAWEDFSGLKKEAVLNKRITEVLPPEELAEITKIYGDVALTGKSIHFEYAVPSLNRIYDIVAFSPRKMHFIVIFTDITERKKAEKALFESMGKYKTLFNSIDEGYCIVEVIFDAHNKPIDYRFLEVNPAFEKQTGLHDAEGKLMRDLRPNHEEYWFEIYGRVALTGKSIRFENPAKALNKFYDVYAFKIGGSESRKVAILFNDISKRKKAEEEIKEINERLNLAQNVANVGTFEWNIQTGINTWTPELEAMYGLHKGQFSGTQEAWEELVHLEDKQNAIKHVNIALKTGKPEETEFRVIWPDGSIHWLLGRWKAIKDKEGELLKLIGVNIDITERKKLEENLREARDSLEEKVEERTIQIEEAYQSLKENESRLKDVVIELERSNEELQSFAYITSHDLQEPLRNIASFAQLLKRRYEGKFDKDADDFLDFMVEGSIRMKGMIQGLLDYSRINRAGIEFVKVNMNDMLQSALSNLKLVINEFNAEVTYDDL
ncbi:MAG: PAS domain S-box protein, partial [Methanobacteriaceae archaeon]|nr:PAS domain S-box protein [Methanobacteriaceae archaeon]